MKFAKLVLATAVLCAPAVAIVEIDSNVNGGRYIPGDTQYPQSFRFQIRPDTEAGAELGSEGLNRMISTQPTAAGEVDVNYNGGRYIPGDTQYPRSFSMSLNDAAAADSAEGLQLMLEGNPTAAGEAEIDSNIRGGRVIPRDTQYMYRSFQSIQGGPPMGRYSGN